MIVAKLRGTRERVRAKEGRREGRKPHGTFEDESEIVERMKALRSAGLSYAAIAPTERCWCETTGSGQVVRRDREPDSEPIVTCRLIASYVWPT